MYTKINEVKIECNLIEEVRVISTKAGFVVNTIVLTPHVGAVEVYENMCDDLECVPLAKIVDDKIVLDFTANPYKKVLFDAEKNLFTTYLKSK